MGIKPEKPTCKDGEAEYLTPINNSKISIGISMKKEILNLCFGGKTFVLRGEPHLVHTLAIAELLPQPHLLQITPTLDNKSSMSI